ncbi:MAG: hypothetical protein ACYC8T_19015 [Myxococcaceae bacterium]
MSGRVRNSHHKVKTPRADTPRNTVRADRAPAKPQVNVWTPPPAGTPDAFVARGTARGATTGAEHGGLPELLLTTAGGVAVNHGSDPGDYYCEHMFFSAQTQAMRPGSSVVANAEGEKLVGFLHLPRDSWSEGTGGAYTQQQRHAGTREVIGAALRGYYDAASPQVSGGPVRMLVTGYGPFMSMRDNPTGDFVAHPENLDAAMKQAFGDNLLSAQGKRIAGEGDDATYQYQVKDPVTGKERTVLVEAVVMPVSDDAIDGTSARSVQKTMDAFKPHAVISMGVNPGGSTYLAEHHADDGGLRSDDGRQVHDDSRAGAFNLPDNYSLPRAIHGGGAPRLAAADRPGRAAGVWG